MATLEANYKPKEFVTSGGYDVEFDERAVNGVGHAYHSLRVDKTGGVYPSEELRERLERIESMLRRLLERG